MNGRVVRAQMVRQFRWQSGKSVRLGDVDLDLDSESAQTNDFKIGSLFIALLSALSIDGQCGEQAVIGTMNLSVLKRQQIVSKKF